jgi:adenylyltransferase/sulfurtransferase
MSNIIISIPTPLRTYTENNKKVEVDAETVKDGLGQLITKYPNLRSHLYAEDELRNYVNVYLNDEDIRYLDDRELTQLKEGDQLAIIPSIAGGKN